MHSLAWLGFTLSLPPPPAGPVLAVVPPALLAGQPVAAAAGGVWSSWPAWPPLPGRQPGGSTGGQGRTDRSCTFLRGRAAQGQGGAAIPSGGQSLSTGAATGVTGPGQGQLAKRASPPPPRTVQPEPAGRGCS